MMPADAVPHAGRPSALLIGHPGHELRVYGWARLVRPKVYILTDGSGTTGTSRLDRSARLLAGLGLETGTVYGRLSDHEIYQAMMNGDVSRFTTMVDDLVNAWIEDGIEVVASDANEGYSPTHDICCEIAQAASQAIQIHTGRRLQRYTFCLTEWEGGKTSAPSMGALQIRLCDELLEEKIAVARSYSELRDEVDRALARKGLDYFREEQLLTAEGWASEDASYKPCYEEYGERRVAEGKYSSVLRYSRHVLPIFRALREYADWRKSLGAEPQDVA